MHYHFEIIPTKRAAEQDELSCLSLEESGWFFQVVIQFLVKASTNWETAAPFPFGTNVKYARFNEPATNIEDFLCGGTSICREEERVQILMAASRRAGELREPACSDRAANVNLDGFLFKIQQVVDVEWRM